MNIPHENEWTAPENARLPDFIICGAMKSGTTTVHNLLVTHPKINIPAPEINFFDMDDIFQHSDFFFKGEERWQWPNITDAPQKYWGWYQKFFEDAPEGCLLGEDSTTYLSSSKAAYRISLQKKLIKAIICLRQPTSRAYSQYWHMLRTGRAMFSFSDTIRFTPNYVLERSMYLNQIIEFMRHIPRERIFFFVLEEFLHNKERVIQRLSNFLSLDYESFSEGAINTHANIASFPNSIKLQVLKNRLLRSYGNTNYTNRLPFNVEQVNRNFLFLFVLHILHKLHGRINPLKQKPAPKMNPATEEFLNQYFQRELQGLGDLIGIDLDQLWFQDKANT